MSNENLKQSDIRAADMPTGQHPELIPITSVDNQDKLNDLARNIDQSCRLEEDEIDEAGRRIWTSLLKDYENLRVSDQADILQQLSPDSRRRLIQDQNLRSLDPGILTHVAEELLDELLDDLTPKQFNTVFRKIDSAEVVDIIASVEDAEKRSRMLAAISLRQRRVVEKYLSYPKYSVGRLMRQNYMAMPHDWSIGQAIDVFRSTELKAIAEDFYALILVDERNRPVGIVNVSQVLRHDRNDKLRDICEEDPISITAETDQEDASNIFRRHGLVEAPVIDEGGELIGTISVQRIFDVIEEEQEDDLLYLSGVKSDDFYQDIYSTAKARIVWLSVNLATAILASWVISQFSDQLAQIVTLAVLMPIVASMGGNAGTQTLAITVRALATNQLTSTNTVRVFVKETIVGLCNGSLLGIMMAGLTWVWFGPSLLPWIIATAMIINSITAGAFGFLIPVGLTRLGWDPAVGSSVVLTTFTDCIGFLAFLGLAALFM